MTYILNTEGIENCLSYFDSIDDQYFHDHKHRLKARLALENILINNQEYFGKDTAFVFKCSERFHRVYFSIEVRGEGYDPRIITDIDNDYLDIIMMRMAGTFEKSPSYQYKNGLNIVSMSLKKTRKFEAVWKMLKAVLAGLILSFAGLIIPSFFKDSILPICEQVCTIILGLIKMSAVPVVFFMVIKSVNSCGSITAIKRRGSNIIRWYLIRYGLLTIMLLLYFFIMFDFSIASSQQGDGFIDTIMGIVTGLFPDSYIKPFLEGNFLLIIVLAFIIGSATLIIGQTADPFLKLCSSMDSIFSQIMEWCCNLLPVYITLVVPTIIWRDKLSMITGIVVHSIGVIVVQSIISIAFFIMMCRRRKISSRMAFSAILPPFIQALITASGPASLPKILDAGENLGVKDKFNELATAIGFVFSNIPISAALGIMLFYLMISCGEVITVAILVKLLISVILLGIANPPVCGGSVATMAILIAMFGIPETCVGIIAPVMFVLGFFNTAFRCADMVTQTVISAVDMQEIEEGV